MRLWHRHQFGPPREHWHQGQTYLAYPCLTCCDLVLKDTPMATQARRGAIRIATRAAVRWLAKDWLFAESVNVREALRAIEQREAMTQPEATEQERRHQEAVNNLRIAAGLAATKGHI